MQIHLPIRSFQSTLPRGSDFIFELLPHISVISIHAPSRERPMVIFTSPPYLHFNPRTLAGATFSFALSSACPSIFQSTLPRGSDFDWYICWLSCHPFQSTLPRGSDQLSSISSTSVTNFNPRSLEGATHTSYNVFVRFCISIHAPSRERPPVPARVIDNVIISIHAPSRERHH